MEEVVNEWDQIVAEIKKEYDSDVLEDVLQLDPDSIMANHRITKYWWKLAYDRKVQVRVLLSIIETLQVEDGALRAEILQLEESKVVKIKPKRKPK